MNSPIRVLIAEDQTLMREGLKTILELEHGFEVVGLAENGQQAVERTALLHPDVVLMDVQMPMLDGVAATAQIMSQPDPPRIIILTTFDYDEYVFAGIRAGAMGYLLKDTPASELLACIRKVHAGESTIQPSIAVRLISEFSGKKPAASSEYEPLSERETDVLRLLAQGMSNREIATKLFLAEGTVKNYVSSILQKFHAANRTQAVHIAQAQGLI